MNIYKQKILYRLFPAFVSLQAVWFRIRISFFIQFLFFPINLQDSAQLADFAQKGINSKAEQVKKQQQALAEEKWSAVTIAVLLVKGKNTSPHSWLCNIQHLKKLC